MFNNNLISKLKIFNNEIYKLESYVNDGVNHIHDHCSELRDKIQLSKEELILSSIDNNNECESEQIVSITNHCDELIGQINIYQNEKIKFYVSNEKSRTHLLESFQIFKLFYVVFYSYWIKKFHENNREISQFDLKRFNSKLFMFDSLKNDLFHKVKIFNLKNDIIGLEEDQEKNVNQMRLYYMQSLNLKLIKEYKFDLVLAYFKVNGYDSKTDNILCEFLTNNLFIITTNISKNESANLVIFNSESNHILVKKVFQSKMITQIKASKELIVINLFQKQAGPSYKLLLMDYNFKIFNKKEAKYIDLIGIDDDGFYIFDNAIRKLDKFFKEKDFIKIQSKNPINQFYLHPLPLVDRCFFKNNKYFFQNSKHIYVFYKNGKKLNEIKSDYGDQILFNESQFIVFKENKTQINYFDLNGNLLREIKVSRVIKTNRFYKIMWDTNLKLVIFDQSELLFYS